MEITESVPATTFAVAVKIQNIPSVWRTSKLSMDQNSKWLNTEIQQNEHSAARAILKSRAKEVLTVEAWYQLQIASPHLPSLFCRRFLGQSYHQIRGLTSMHWKSSWLLPFYFLCQMDWPPIKQSATLHCVVSGSFVTWDYFHKVWKNLSDQPIVFSQKLIHLVIFKFQQAL